MESNAAKLPWFSTKGQIAQVAFAAAACVFAGFKAWPEMKQNEYLSTGALLFYSLVGLVVASIVMLARAVRTAARPQIGAVLEGEPLGEVRDLRGERYRPLAPIETFHIIQAGPQDPEPQNPNINWKRKFIVVLRCNDKGATEVHAPDWVSSSGYIPFQPHPRFWSILRTENVPKGGWTMDKWDEECSSITLSPNTVFQASVGLAHCFSIEEFKSRAATRRVGMLVLPVKIDGREMEWRYRF